MTARKCTGHAQLKRIPDDGSPFARLLASTAVLVTLMVVPASAQQVFIIDAPETTTNGGETVDDGDTLIVTPTGSIDVSATPGQRAMDGAGPGITLENQGRLTSVNAHGMFIDNGNGSSMDSSGDITTTGDSAAGQLLFGNDASIINSGTITTYGNFSRGQNYSGLRGQVQNFGTISTYGNQAYGQLTSGTDGIIMNFGSITTFGDDAYGQYYIDHRGTLENFGSIVTHGDDSMGQILVGEDGIVRNSGSIMTTGPSAFGIFTNGDGNSVFNSGRVVSVQSDAIRMERAARTLTLQAPGFIGGDIRFVIFDDSAAVNVITGPSHSIFWTFDGDIDNNTPNFSGSVPWFYDEDAQTVATFDPTLLAAESAALGDLTSQFSRVGLGAMEGFASGFQSDNSFSPLGFMPLAGSEANAFSHRLGRAWATAVGGQMDPEGGRSTLDSTVGQAGFAIGYTWQQTPDLILNAMAGYLAGNVEADAVWAPSFEHDVHTMFAGMHGERSLSWGQFGEGVVQFGLTAGYGAIDHSRFVNDNLAPLGESWVSADYGGFFLSPELGLATDISLADGTVLTTNAGLRYAAQWLGGYTETGAFNPAANATVEDRFVGVLETRIGVDATRTFSFGSVTGRIGYLGRWSAGDDAATISLNGITQPVAPGVQDLNAAYVGGTLRTDLGEAAFLELDANYVHGDTAQGFDGQLRVGLTF
jgi:hypothetical protein